jgi:hypothetical protein
LLYGLRMRRAWLIVGCLAWPALAPAEWHQWRDANGTLHVINQASPSSRAKPAAAPPEHGGGQDAATAPVNALAAGTPANAAGDTARRAADPRDDRRQRLELRLQNNLRHLALLSRAPADDPARAELQNTLTDAVRADREALAALQQDETAP